MPAVQLERIGDGSVGGGNLWVSGTINGVMPVQFVIDSGASFTTLPLPMARQLMAAGMLSQSDVIGMKTFGFADGRSEEHTVFRLRSLTVGSITLHNVTATVSSGSEPLLGQTFLGRLGSWSIDNARGALVMRCQFLNWVPTLPTRLGAVDPFRGLATLCVMRAS